MNGCKRNMRSFEAIQTLSVFIRRKVEVENVANGNAASPACAVFFVLIVEVGKPKTGSYHSLSVFLICNYEKN